MSELILEFIQYSSVFLLSYSVIIVAPFILIYFFYLNNLQHRAIIKTKKDDIKLKKVIYKNLTSLSVFISFIAIYVFCNHNDLNQTYTQINGYGWGYFIFSVIAGILLHDAYFYFTHYLMHQFKFLHRFHAIHHQEIRPNPLSAFYFHPVEAIIQFVFFAALPVFLPMHPAALYFLVLWMLACNSAGHLSLEFYPSWLYKFPITRHWNAATHHIMHHESGTSNYSIYYTWWDKLFKTLNPKYYERYQIVHHQIKTHKKNQNSLESGPAIKI